MNIQQLREQFAAELNRHRLPHAYIERLLAEWDDHIADLQDERSTDMAGTPEIVNFQERLGDPVQLAAVAAKQYHHRSFLGRHPIFTFVILPLPLVLLGLIAVLCSVVLLGYANYWWLSNIKAEEHPLAQNITCVLLAWSIIVLPPLFAILFLCRIGRRNALKWRWSLLSCVIVAALLAMLQTGWRLATLPQTGQFMIGIGFDPTSPHYLFLNFLPKFALAMGVGLLLIKRATRLQKLDEIRHETAVFRQAA